MYVFELPEIGEGVLEGEIVQWLVKEGDNVHRDQPLCEVMTDKATIEISSPVGGRVARLHGSPGDIVHVHSPLVEFDQTGDAVAPVAHAGHSGHAPAAPAAPPAPAAAAPAAVAATAPAPAARASGEKTLASPAVRSYARENEVDIQAIAGSGKGGRVTRADIDALGQAPTSAAPPAAPVRTAPAPTPSAPTPSALPAVQAPAWAGAATGRDEVVKIIGLRRKIAEKMVESYSTKPHFTYVDEVDATELVALRAALKEQAAARGVSLTYLPFILKALAVVFRQFPTVNSTLDEKTMEMTIHGTVNIGVATDTPAGLYVPVVKHVEQKSILELAAELAALTERTRQGRVGLDDLQGGTFTVTSVGNIGGRFATPIINAPECAILGVNQIHDRPVVKDGQIVACKMMYLSPSFDHRVLDGAVAARFTSALKEVLENPARMLLELR